MDINLKILKNDFKRNRAGNLSLLLFMTLAASLVVVAVIVVTQLISSIKGMYHTAQPPHFLQMHKGALDQQAIDEFNQHYSGVTAWQTLPTIALYGDDLTVQGDEVFDLSDCRLDISLVKQNPSHDLLLDHDRNVIQVNNGEIGIPIILLDRYTIKLGDTVVLNTNGVSKEFTVVEFVRDAQMNSTLCSSTRMLISDQDFEALLGNVGETEYLIEAYFTDTAMAADYQTAYENANLPRDGQAVTYSAIFLLSAFRDIAMAMILIGVSMFLVIIALMCIKYTVMATLEEEIREIGTMKAIGMSFKDIRSLYLIKYKLMVAGGIVIGYVLAVLMAQVFTRHISNTFGNQPVSLLTLSLPLVGCGLLYLITISFVKLILNKLRSVTVINALVTQKGFGKKERVKDGLYRSKALPVDLLLSMRNVTQSFSDFTIVFVVLLVVAGIIIVPLNLINTMESKEFISYMGSSVNDILIEVDSGQNLESRYAVIKALLKDDTQIAKYQELRRVRTQTLDAEGQWSNIHVDSGANAGASLKYLAGNAPSTPQELALSKLNADKIGKGVGDKIILRYADTQEIFTISGVYQDVTSGGYTAKASYSFTGAKSEKYQFTVDLLSGVDATSKAAQWSSQTGAGYDIEPMEEFIYQTLGGVARQIKVAAVAVALIAVFLVGLVIVLFMKLRLAKDAPQIAGMKAVGFTNFDIRKQYLYKIGLVSILGIYTGTLIANLLGQSIVSGALSMMGFGLSKITFIINPWVAFIAIPLVLLAVAVHTTWISTRPIQEYNIISLIYE